ncbi:hypothetical protein [Aquimarina sp. 2201CG14-23]|uniref:hypothetical protein n=1 Tax=Aquimarina mycalae TaxID=3040073 RepID=UPI002477D925|nr:hypothetical protein [Aquimarina sp. 2201CG14-23]MDH7447723.1 hypothetical protein [Aquimarina sp. 2201CG14-23]
MKTQLTITKRKTNSIIKNIGKLFIKWGSAYVSATSKALYPDANTPSSEHDKNRIFYK